MSISSSFSVQLCVSLQCVCVSLLTTTRSRKESKRGETIMKWSKTRVIIIIIIITIVIIIIAFKGAIRDFFFTISSLCYEQSLTYMCTLKWPWRIMCISRATH